MSTEEIIFKHPPATEVQLGIAFPNNFEVADQRNRFYSNVRKEFPIIIMPEQSKMAYDFADYSLQGTHDCQSYPKKECQKNGLGP
jgi:hypothetical protein